MMLRRASDSGVIRLRELRAKRKSLWRRFEENPNEVHLAAKLKIIDDQIAQPNQQSDRAADKIDDPEVGGIPEVGSLFLV